jgi:SAM-dependent methyltransferase
VRSWRRRLRVGRTLRRRFPAPASQWNEDYARRHAELVSFLLDDADALALFRHGESLPRGYGVAFDERVVEYPWFFAQGPRGRVLDAGSTLNHAHVLERLLPTVEALEIVTLAPEAESFPGRRVTYRFADLRDLPYEDGAFDTVASLSTIEHVGMDTTVYGAREPRAADPRSDVRRAMRELRRVTAPGGMLLATVPYGVPSDHGWFRQFDRDDIGDLVAAAAPAHATVLTYRHTAAGWRLSSLDEAADATYWDHHSDPAPPDDRAAAARAVACIRLEV